jgi:hypothetical protein
MGAFWTAIVAAYLAAYPGATLTLDTEGAPWPFICSVQVQGGGVDTFGWAEMPDRWDPEPIEDTCDRAAWEMMAFECEWHEPPGAEYCQF